MCVSSETAASEQSLSTVLSETLSKMYSLHDISAILLSNGCNKVGVQICPPLPIEVVGADIAESRIGRNRTKMRFDAAFDPVFLLVRPNFFQIFANTF